MNFRRGETGQTLIETMVAISILTMALVVSLGLATYSEQATNHASKQVTATALARQGIEAVKNYRDTQWLGDTLVFCPWVSASNAQCYPNWLGNGTPIGGPSPTGVDYSLHYKTSNGNWQFNATPGTYVLNYDPATGEYSTTGSGVPSIFSRKVNIAWDNTPPFATAQPTRVIVTSTVWWSDNYCPTATDPSILPASCKVILEMHLTNWRTF